MKKALYLCGAVLTLVLTPVAAYADCDTGCWRHCGTVHEGNEAAYIICYDGCMYGCQNPQMPTVPSA